MWRNILGIVQSKIIKIFTRQDNSFSLNLNYILNRLGSKHLYIDKNDIEIIPLNNNILFGTRGTDFQYFPKGYSFNYDKDDDLFIDGEECVKYVRNIGYLNNILSVFDDRQDSTEESMKQWYLYHIDFNIYRPFILKNYRKGIAVLYTDVKELSKSSQFDVYINDKFYKHFVSRKAGQQIQDPLVGVFHQFICYFNEYSEEVKFEVKNVSDNIRYIIMWQIKAYPIQREYPDGDVIVRRKIQESYLE